MEILNEIKLYRIGIYSGWVGIILISIFIFKIPGFSVFDNLSGPGFQIDFNFLSLICIGLIMILFIVIIACYILKNERFEEIANAEN